MLYRVSYQVSIALGVIIILILVAGTHNRFAANVWPLPFTPHASPKENKWLIATMSPAKTASRRAVVRSTWQKFFDRDLYDTRFVLSEYDPVWEALIQQENQTHGDLIKLEGLDPGPHPSQRLKTMAFFSRLVETEQKYGWVTKIDQDAYLAVGRYYTKFISPSDRQSNVIIGKKVRNLHYKDWDWPAGALYTLSWPLLERVVKLHRRNNDTDLFEDVRMGMYLHQVEGGYQWKEFEGTEFVEVPVPNAILPGKIHGDTMLVHYLKDDYDYLSVAGVFDEQGYTGKELHDWTDTTVFAGVTPQDPTDPIRGTPKIPT